MGNYSLTLGQTEASVKLIAFLEGPGRIFRLTGKPGVGKTFLLGHVLRNYTDVDKNSNNTPPNINVAGVTLSHRAKNVLGEYIPNVFTFAKTFGLKEKIHDNGHRSFEYNKYEKDCVGDMSIPVFVHDEISQYTDEMQNIMLERTSMFSKIILVGDKAQLPPIEDKNSLNYVVDRDSSIFDLQVDDEYELTERVRQEADNPILQLSDIIREEIFGDQNMQRILFSLKQPVFFDNKGYSSVTYFDLASHHAQFNPLDTTVIAFKNMTVKFYNQLIRNHRLDCPEQALIDTDIVMMQNNYTKMDEQGFPIYRLHNSDTLELDKVHVINDKVFLSGRNYYIECYIAEITNGSEFANKKFITPTEKGSAQYEMALTEIADRCHARKANWADFWTLKDYYCQYDYGYAMTAYKVQGSTYENVYVDVQDILQTKPLTPKRKLQTLYTAITRAKHMVYFLSNE